MSQMAAASGVDIPVNAIELLVGDQLARVAATESGGRTSSSAAAPETGTRKNFQPCPSDVRLNSTVNPSGEKHGQ